MFQPTDEQVAILDAFRTGGDMVVEAGAGVGKTRSIQMLAESDPNVRVQFCAFNKSVVVDATERMPANTTCNTVHSLAFRSAGTPFARRLNSARMPGRELARRLGVTSLKIGEKWLSDAYLASLATRGVVRFCQTADPEPAEHHIPYVDGIDEPENGKRGWRHNRQLRAYLAPFMARVWEDAINVNGELPYRHDFYVKLAQLRGIHIAADVVMVDECQPPGTMVLCPLPTKGKERVRFASRPIEDLEVGDRVVSYDSTGGARLSSRGRAVDGITRNHYSGPMITVTTASGESSRYTANHICLVRIGDCLTDKTILYLMRRGSSWRIGTTSAWHGTDRTGRNGSSRRASGLAGRMREEGGDGIWLLATFDNKDDALLEESFIASQYGIPDATFAARWGWNNQERLDRFWERIGDNTARAINVLDRFGRDVRYPFSTPRSGFICYTRTSAVRACNLLDGMYVATMQPILDRRVGDDASAYMNIPADSWKQITVSREHYDGDVISLSVNRDKTYVSDSIITHNCQDISPVFAAIIEQQRAHAQIIAIGDGNQAIYGFTGALDYLQQLDAQHRLYLSQSFRFGPAIADLANELLAVLPTELRLRGLASIPSRIGTVDAPDACLYRTNAGAVGELIRLMEAGVSAHLVGGANDVVSFARAAADLIDGRRTSHQELACFETWFEVQDYVKSDAMGDEIKLLVGLIDRFGPATIINALERMPGEKVAKVVLSTAHRGKGRQWPQVRLGGDFPDDLALMADEEIRLMYVAVTRAQLVLDPRLVGCLSAESMAASRLSRGVAAPLPVAA